MSLVLATAVEIPHQVLIVTGHNNHKWEVSSVVYKQILEQTGLFNVDMAIRPPLDKETDIFHPNFSQYDVVFLEYYLVFYLTCSIDAILYHLSIQAFVQTFLLLRMVSIASFSFLFRPLPISIVENPWM